MISIDQDAGVQAECLRLGADRFLPKSDCNAGCSRKSQTFSPTSSSQQTLAPGQNRTSDLLPAKQNEGAQWARISQRTVSPTAFLDTYRRRRLPLRRARRSLRCPPACSVRAPFNCRWLCPGRPSPPRHKWWNDHDAGLATNRNKEGWTLGVGFEVPLFDGGLTRAKVTEMRARLSQLKEQGFLLKEGIGLQIKDHFLGLIAARKSHQATLDAMNAAEENRDLNTRACLCPATRPMSSPSAVC